MSHSKENRGRLRDNLLAFFKSKKPDIPIAASLQTDAEEQTHETLYHNPPQAFSIFYGGHSYLKKNGTAALEVVIKSRKDLTVENLSLDVDGQRFPSLNWQPLKIANSYSRFHLFKLSDVLGSVPELRLTQVRLIALTEGIENRSPSFDISALIV